MTMLNTNGKARKSLASQLDRLDEMLDGLSEALNESVAMAVKDAVTLAVREAVQAVMTEVLSNPAIVARLQALAGTAPRQATPRRTWQDRVAPLARRVVGVCQVIRENVQAVAQWTRQRVCGVAARARGTWTAVRGVARYVRPFGAPLLAALLCGLVLGVAAFSAGPGLSAMISGGSGFTAALLAQVGLWLRRALAVCGVQRDRPLERTLA